MLYYIVPPSVIGLGVKTSKHDRCGGVARDGCLDPVSEWCGVVLPTSETLRRRRLVELGYYRFAVRGERTLRWDIVWGWLGAAPKVKLAGNRVCKAIGQAARIANPGPCGLVVLDIKS